MPHNILKPAMQVYSNMIDGLLRQLVVQQDKGEAVGELLVNCFGQSGAHHVSIAIHEKRLLMIAEGRSVKKVPTDGSSFILGFAEINETAKPSTEEK